MNKILYIIMLLISLVAYRTYTYKCDTCGLIFEYGEQGTKICPRDGSFLVPDYEQENIVKVILELEKSTDFDPDLMVRWLNIQLQYNANRIDHTDYYLRYLGTEYEEDEND